MYYTPYTHQNPYYANVPAHTYGSAAGYWAYPNDLAFNSYRSFYGDSREILKDYGSNPFVININEAAKQNSTYRTALWTGKSFAGYINES